MISVCSLLSSCHLQENLSSYPTLINSGPETCVPEPFKRRKCLPGCSEKTPFCHGRCVFGGRKCFFHPCSQNPYREDAEESCSEFIHNLIETDNDGCLNACSNLSTESGEIDCQNCLIDNVPEECKKLSGASCYKCSVPVLQALDICLGNHQNPLDINHCIAEKQSTSCQQCTCTVLCYESPDSNQCRSCLHHPQLAAMFVNNEFCQQGLNILNIFLK